MFSVRLPNETSLPQPTPRRRQEEQAEQGVKNGDKTGP